LGVAWRIRERELSSAALSSERSIGSAGSRCLTMAVRLKLRIKVDGRSAVDTSLLNSGYEAPTPQLLIPVDLVRRLDLWPPQGASEARARNSSLKLVSQTLFKVLVARWRARRDFRQRPSNSRSAALPLEIESRRLVLVPLHAHLGLPPV